MVKVEVQGLAELMKAMQELPKELHKGPLRSAVGAGAKVVQDAAKGLAPRDEGTLQKAIYRTRSRSESSAVQETAIVGVRFGRRYRRRGQDAWYWRFIEFGTVKMAARPFLRPAFETTKAEQLKVLQERLKKAIERAAAKVRK